MTNAVEMLPAWIQHQMAAWPRMLAPTDTGHEHSSGETVPLTPGVDPGHEHSIGECVMPSNDLWITLTKLAPDLWATMQGLRSATNEITAVCERYGVVLDCEDDAIKLVPAAGITATTVLEDTNEDGACIWLTMSALPPADGNGGNHGIVN